MLFEDRYHAGSLLGKELKKLGYDHSYLILGLPRGGVPVAFEVAHSLKAALDVFVIRKLGVPGQKELAFGAIGPGNKIIINRSIIESLGLSKESMQRVIEVEAQELERRLSYYRKDRTQLNIKDKKVILVDDGLATGASMSVACEAIKQSPIRELHVAAPVGSSQACHALAGIADNVVCLYTPEPFLGVGRWYHDFSQTTDDEVTYLLDKRWDSSEFNSAI